MKDANYVQLDGVTALLYTLTSGNVLKFYVVHIGILSCQDKKVNHLLLSLIYLESHGCSQLYHGGGGGSPPGYACVSI